MKFYDIFFSPTGGTKKVADIVAKGTKLVAVLSYGGRIPLVCVQKNVRRLLFR